MTGIRPLGDRVVIKKAEMEEKTVSYTHLDVYKRQSSTSSRGN